MTTEEEDADSFAGVVDEEGEGEGEGEGGEEKEGDEGSTVCSTALEETESELADFSE